MTEADKVILEVDADGNQKARNVVGTNLISRTVDDITGYYFYNGHGDTTTVAEAVYEDVLVSYYYDAFGNPETVQGSVYNSVYGSVYADRFDNPFLFAGYYWDSETGKYYLMARMYDPETARFLSEDERQYTKIDDPLSLNLYVYCHNEPIMYTDPDGHDPLEMKWITQKIDEQKEKWSSYEKTINKTLGNMKKSSGNASNKKIDLNGLGNNVKDALLIKSLRILQDDAHKEANKLREQLGKVPNPDLNADERKMLIEKTKHTEKYNQKEWLEYKSYLDSLSKKYNSYDNIKLTMYVDTPNPSSREAINFKAKGPVGHTFVGIRFKDDTERLFGFYPNEQIKPINQISKYLEGVRGNVKDNRVDEKSDEGHPYDEEYPVNITPETGFNAFNYAYNYEVNSELGNNRKYYYTLDKNNCTTFSVNVFEAAGVKQPVNKHKWTISAGNRAQIWSKQNNISINKAFTLTPYGYNTADAAEDIRINRNK
ncbi:MAG: RHS repeat-associated core domain-containing protein [Deltaproteobacteria bacterium]